MKDEVLSLLMSFLLFNSYVMSSYADVVFCVE